MTVEALAWRRNQFFTEARRRIKEFRKRRESQRQSSSSPTPEPQEIIPDFTDREIEVIEYTALGMTDTQAALASDLSPNTITTHKKNVHARIDPTGVMEYPIAMCRAISITGRQGLIDLSSLKNTPNNVLTTREVQVLSQFGTGLSREEIIEKLSLSPKTLRKHLTNIYPKLGVHTIYHAVGIHIANPQKPADSKVELLQYHVTSTALKAMREGKSVTGAARQFAGRTTKAVRRTYNRKGVLFEAIGRIKEGEYQEEDAGARANTLTGREKEIVVTVMQGNTSHKEIAEAIGITPDTVKVHLKHIHKKLGTKTIVGVGLFGLSLAATLGVIKVRHDRQDKKDEERS